jgi:hypothetical protein
LIDENVKHPKVEVQYAAVKCMREFSLRYHATKSEQARTSMQKILRYYTKHVLTDPNPAIRRGYVLALGALSSNVLQIDLNHIIETLIKTSELEEDKTMRDAETRANSIESLLEICQKSSVVLIGRETVHKIYQAMLNALEDYSVDNRGDVGSWVREATILSLAQLAILLVREDVKNNSDESSELFFTREMSTALFQGLVKQSVEKIDRIRDVASAVLGCLLYTDDVQLMNQSKSHIGLRVRLQKMTDSQLPVKSENGDWVPVTIPFIPHREKLQELISKTEYIRGLTFNVFQGVYPRMIRCFTLDCYCLPLLTGLCASIGGLSKQSVSNERLFKKSKRSYESNFILCF